MASGRVKYPNLPWVVVLRGLGQLALQLATRKAAVWEAHLLVSGTMTSTFVL